MNKKIQAKHIKALQALFPNSFIKPSQDFYGHSEEQSLGIWTGFAEDGTFDYWMNYVDPKLQSYIDSNDLFLEPHDAGTLMIWEG